MTPSERSEVKVVVFLADLDAAYNRRTADDIQRHYADHINSGLLTILRVQPDFYPPLVGLHRNFGDTVRTVRLFRSSANGRKPYVFLLYYYIIILNE